MKRREFMEALGGMGMAAQTGSGQKKEQKTKFYHLQQFFLKNGTQAGRIHDYFSKTLLPAMNKVHSGPKIILEALVTPHMPQVATIFGYESFEEYWTAFNTVIRDEEFRKGFTAWEKAPEAPTEHYSSWWLKATSYSPEIEAPSKPPEKPRIFELRTYHSPSNLQLEALHERFAGPEIKIFHRVGVHPILYSETVFGPHKPNLTYVTPFDDLAAREKAWAAFGADPEWIKVRKESIDKHGQISSIIQISLYRAAPYSPVR